MISYANGNVNPLNFICQTERLVAVMLTQHLMQLTTQLADCMNRLQWRLGVAESCTGGSLSSALTAIPGSSTWFDRGLITYSNTSKTALLGVSPRLLETHGAVSEAVALAMVEGLLAKHPVAAGIAITGIAGPDGGTLDKPVGSVWIAWMHQGKGGAAIARYHHFEGDRLQIREQSVMTAIQGLVTQLALTDSASP